MIKMFNKKQDIKEKPNYKKMLNENIKNMQDYYESRDVFVDVLKNLYEVQNKIHSYEYPSPFRGTFTRPNFDVELMSIIIDMMYIAKKYNWEISDKSLYKVSDKMFNNLLEKDRKFAMVNDLRESLMEYISSDECDKNREDE